MEQQIRYIVLSMCIVLLWHCSDAPRAERGPTKERAVIDLPKPDLKGSFPLQSALERRESVRSFRDRPLRVEEISQLLWAAQGRTRNGAGRTAPSAGALYPLEVYVATPEALYRYLSQTHRMEQIMDGNPIPELASAAFGQSCVSEAPAVIVITARIETTRRRYATRAERYVHMEAGHAAQNVHLQAVALGLGSVAVGAFKDDAAARALRLGKDESPIYLIPVGEPR